jgi:choline kinase
VNAVILSAGRGRRLLPLTRNVPKCLLRVAGRSILDWQIRELADAGIERSTVVVGFGADQVRAALASQYPRTREVIAVDNPFFDLADNLVSCWIARDHMKSDFLLINGDTLFEAGVLQRLLDAERAPVTIAISHKASYDSDDMKIEQNGSLLCRVGKDLPPGQTHGESIGMLLFRGAGPRLFRDEIERAMREPTANRLWYLSAIGALAKRNLVRTVSVDAFGWAEVDQVRDLESASRDVARWSRAAQPALQATA